MQHPNKNWKTPSSFCLRSESPFRLLETLLVGEEALVVGVALAGAAAVESVEGFFRVGASGRASSLTTTGTTVSFWKIRHYMFRIKRRGKLWEKKLKTTSQYR